MDRPIFTFDTTHHALWAEELARGEHIPSEIIPAPPQANARCDLAIETLPEDIDRFSRILEQVGIVYRLYGSQSPRDSHAR